MLEFELGFSKFEMSPDQSVRNVIVSIPSPLSNLKNILLLSPRIFMQIYIFVNAIEVMVLKQKFSFIAKDILYPPS